MEFGRLKGFDIANSAGKADGFERLVRVVEIGEAVNAGGVACGKLLME